jgi:hypothetical protein
VDLELVATVLEADPMRCHGAFLDLLTGEIAMTADVFWHSPTPPDSDMADDEGVRNREAEPDRSLPALPRFPSGAT